MSESGKQLWMSLLALVFIAASCSDSTDGRTITEAGYKEAVQLEVGDTKRSFDLYVPDLRNDGPRPLVLLFHGQRGSASQLMGRSGRGAAPFSEWLRIADENGIVLAIPDGTEGSEGHSGWNDCRSDAASNPASDDVAFVAAFIDEVDASLPIDRDRVFATGISNGGHLSLRLAIERPDMVAAVAPIAAAMPANSSCPEPLSPVPVFLINGTEDPFLPWEGGSMPAGRGTVLSAFDSVQVWAELGGVTPVAEVTDLPNTSTDDGSTVVAHRYSGGSTDVDVWLYEVAGGGHTDPSRAEHYTRLFKRVVGEQNRDIETADEIWAFFDSS